MTLDRWTQLMSTLGLPENQDTYTELLETHAEKQHHYHNAAHVEACLTHLDKVKYLLEDPAEVELAFWFHDAIYKT